MNSKTQQAGVHRPGRLKPAPQQAHNNPRQPRHHRQHGFTLIEAIVSLVLMATTGMALFSWINTNLITLSRVQAINAQDSATSNALEFITKINPMDSPSGQTQLGAYRLSWQAQATTEARDGASYPMGIGLYQFVMYQTTVSVDQTDGQPWFSFNLQQVGYKKVRSILPPF